jgi:glycosyltransferase involved in cell wall biosynthesis
LNKVIIFVQTSPVLAGSQRSLSLLTKGLLESSCTPCVLTSKQGWLTDDCRKAGIPFLIVPFSRSRSLGGRLLGNRLFARHAAAAVGKKYPDRNIIVHGNDHQESLLTLALGKKLGVKTFLTLRTPGMSRKDFEKYYCREHSQVITVGDELHRKVSAWNSKSSTSMIYNGIAEDNFHEPLPFVSQFPEKIIVLGSGEARKGWADLIQALLLLEEKRPDLPDCCFDFLGSTGGNNLDEILMAQKFRHFRVRHLPHTPDFINTARKYAFAVHPSRHESFGRAALEILAAGVPMLSTRTGTIDQVLPEQWLCGVKSPESLARKLESVVFNPEKMIFPAEEVQMKIRQQFSVENMTEKILKIYAQN